MIKKIILFALLLITQIVAAQPTFPQNGVFDNREKYFAFTNATIYISPDKKLENATLIIHQGRIEAVGQNIEVPKAATTISLKGMTVYPSFIDLYTNYGMPEAKAEGKAPEQSPQMLSNKKGAFAWNEALKSEFQAAQNFTRDEKSAEEWRNLGFGTVLTQRMDGISRGSAALVTLGSQKEHLEIVKSNAAHALSFRKGTSTQSYPSSQMGSIALLRQTYLDGEWYKKTGYKEETNNSIAAWNTLQDLPQIFETTAVLEELRAIDIANEFKTKYILKGKGDEYQRIEDVKALKAPLILSLNFPTAYDVEDPYDAQQATLTDLKHWELAPSNPAFVATAKIPFAFTTFDLKEKKAFLKNVIKSVKRGLPKTEALRALTLTPAKLLDIENEIGSLEKGKIANFIITSGDIFEESTTIYQNWVRGQGFIINKIPTDLRGTYILTIGNEKYIVEGEGKIEKPTFFIPQKDSTKLPLNVKVNYPLVSLYFNTTKEENTLISLSGSIENNVWKGNGTIPNGIWTSWSMIRDHAFEEKKEDKPTVNKDSILGKIIYPFMAFGNETLPTAQTFLIKNTTVWTNEKEGILTDTDVLLKNGKIAAIGKGLSESAATVIDGKNKHLTAGIIDEHSHIAISKGVNEGSQESTAEVRIGDVVNSEDINIYRQLAGGVTTAQLLHGSANPIGGQSQIIKLKWGYTPQEMKLPNGGNFIKFALGENVKQSNWGDNARIRFPQTRMGVEQVFSDYFTRAKLYNADKSKSKRRDLDLETLAEILNKERFITCHSYVQSEINMLMKVAESFGFTLNTFTHILEGYKVADKMKQHGAAASTFADWWAYKMEVQEAIPYNGALMHEQGLLVGFNSDDAEMGRRLNQEAAKAVEYGGVSEIDALKFVTLNPAKMLHIDDRVGSIKEGKDADVVLWSAHPLSVYARAEITFIEGVKFFDRKDDALKQQVLRLERQRIIQKMLGEKAEGGATQPVKPKHQHLYHCDDIEEEVN